MTDFRLFSGNATGQTDRGGFTDDLGVQFKVTTDGVHDAILNGFYFWAPSTGDFDHTKYSWRLYSSTNGTSGTLISGSTTNVAVDFTASSWNYQALASPITLTNNTTYYAVLHSTSTGTHYTGTDSYWSSGAGASGISAGPITAPGTATALNGAQCAYNEPSATAAFPTSSLGTNYWLDVSISYDGPITDSFTSTGTWTCPTGVTSATVKCWGGGGSGGTATGTSGSSGGGGAGGAFASSVLSVTAGSNYTVTVGSGGAHDTTPTEGQRVNGGDSWFNTSSTIIAKGGEGGQHTVNNGSHGLGGTGTATSSIGDTVYAGGSGAAGTSTVGGGGGGGAGTTGAGGAASGSTAGTGTALLGGDGSAGSTSTASAASVYGGGGGGAHTSSTTNRQGGDGAAGRVEITWQIVSAVSANAGVAMTTASAQPSTATKAVAPAAGKAAATAAALSAPMAHPAPGAAAATAAALAPVVATGAPAGRATVTASVLAPTITDSDSAPIESAAVMTAAHNATVTFATTVAADISAAVAAAYGATVFVESNVSAGVATATVVALDSSSSNTNVFPGVGNAFAIANVTIQPGTAHAIPAVVRMAVYDPEVIVYVDSIASTAQAFDAVAQVAIVADAGLAEVNGDVGAVDSQPVATAYAAQADGVTVGLYLTQINSTSNPGVAKSAVFAAAFNAGLRIGAGLSGFGNAQGNAYDAVGHATGGTSDIVRVLRVGLGSDRIYTIPHESREIRIKRT